MLIYFWVVNVLNRRPQRARQTRMYHAVYFTYCRLKDEKYFNNLFYDTTAHLLLGYRDYLRYIGLLIILLQKRAQRP